MQRHTMLLGYIRQVRGIQNE